MQEAVKGQGVLNRTDEENKEMQIPSLHCKFKLAASTYPPPPIHTSQIITRV